MEIIQQSAKGSPRKNYYVRRILLFVVLLQKINDMEETKHIKISDYNYPLPDERIAKFPLPVRDQSKLLVYQHGQISETHFTSLPDYLEPGTLMIFNNTKVIQARLHFRKETGALIEIFCLEPIEPNDYVLNFQQTQHAAWLCMIGNLKKWKEGHLHKEMTVKGKTLTLTATELALLRKLAENRGHIVTYDALCAAVWGADYYGYENSLGVHIRHLREKLEAEPGAPQFLRTVRGIGYKLTKGEEA